MGFKPTYRVIRSALLMSGALVTGVTQAAPRSNTADLCNLLMQRLSGTPHSITPETVALNSSVGKRDQMNDLKTWAQEISDGINNSAAPADFTKNLKESFDKFKYAPSTTMRGKLAQVGKTVLRRTKDPLNLFSSHELGILSLRKDTSIQEIVRTTKVEQTIRRKVAKNPNKHNQNDRDVLDVIEQIQRKSVLDTADIDKIKIFRDEIKSIFAKAEELRQHSDLPGDISLLVNDYIQQNKSDFRKQLSALEDDEMLYVAIPKLTKIVATGDYRVDMEVKGFTKLDAFDTYVNSVERTADDTRRLRKSRIDYADRYLTARYLAKQLPGATEEGKHIEAIFSHDDVLTAAEAANKARYDDLVKDIGEIFDRSKEIHPSPESLKYIRFANNSTHRATRIWAGVAGTGVILGIGWKYLESSENKYKRAKAELEDKQDKDNIYNEDYWVKKCSSKPNAVELAACIKKFANLLQQDLVKTLDERKAQLAVDQKNGKRIGEEIDSTTDNAHIMESLQSLTRKLRQSTSTAVFTDQVVDLVIGYSGQIVFSDTVNSVAELKKSKQEKDKKAESDDKNIKKIITDSENGQFSDEQIKIMRTDILKDLESKKFNLEAALKANEGDTAKIAELRYQHSIDLKDVTAALFDLIKKQPSPEVLKELYHDSESATALQVEAGKKLLELIPKDKKPAADKLRKEFDAIKKDMDDEKAADDRDNTKDKTSEPTTK